jgi:hypothetical protein
MADKNPWIEVPVTSQLEESFVFEVTPELLEKTGCECVHELRDRVELGEVDIFAFDGDWEVGDQMIESIHYEWSRVC